MKRKSLLIALCLVLCIGLAIAAGDANDPLVSLSYLTGKFTDSFSRSAEGKMNAADSSLRDTASSQLNAAVSGIEVKAHSNYAASFEQTRLKKSDTIAGTTGMGFMLLAGNATVQFSSGSVIDVTDGKAVSSGSAVTSNHRYLVAEDTSATYTVTSKTAVVEYEGYYLVTDSSATDYNEMAEALNALTLFRGSDTGYGSGYDLEVAPTRIQSVIMLLRSLGEEDAALRCTYSHPFKDVPEWCDRYVAYAYHQGYSNGVSTKEFDPNSKVTAVQFVELLLRSTGYSTAGVDNWETALQRAQSAGVITAGEYSVYTSTTFMRADCVYFFYYLLDTPLKGSSTTLAQRLISAGIFDGSQLNSAQALVNSIRIS